MRIGWDERSTYVDDKAQKYSKFSRLLSQFYTLLISVNFCLLSEWLDIFSFILIKSWSDITDSELCLPWRIWMNCEHLLHFWQLLLPCEWKLLPKFWQNSGSFTRTKTFRLIFAQNSDRIWKFWRQWPKFVFFHMNFHDFFEHWCYVKNHVLVYFSKDL